MAAQAGFIRLGSATKPKTLSAFAQLKLIGVREEGSMIGTKIAFPIQLQRKEMLSPGSFPFSTCFIYEYLGINFIFNSCCSI